MTTFHSISILAIAKINFAAAAVSVGEEGQK